MAHRKTVSISISPELHAVAERLLASGRYGNFSEVIRAALRLLDERERAFESVCAIDTTAASASDSSAHERERHVCAGVRLERHSARAARDVAGGADGRLRDDAGLPGSHVRGLGT